LTSEAVLTELSHLVGEDRRETESAWRLLCSGAVKLAAITHGELPQIRALMSRYWDRPMDFADATGRESLSTIFTVDYAGASACFLPNAPDAGGRANSF
jgi:hypothetical protein